MTGPPGRYKVIQWTTGHVGRSALRYVLDHPRMELVGVKCFSERKEGRDAGELVRRDPVGVVATRDEAALLGLDADCVIFTPDDSTMTDPSVPGSRSHTHLQTALRILRSGKNIVSPLCPPTHYRHFADPDWFIEQVESACAEGRSSIHFTGIDPGFFTDVFAVTLSSTCGRVDQVRTWGMLDYYTAPYVDGLSTMGFGRPAEATTIETKASWIRETWGGVPHLLADAFGVRLERVEVEAEPWLAPQSYRTAGGLLIQKGTVGAWRFALNGIVGGRTAFSTNHVNRMGPDSGPTWPQVGHDGGYRIEIDGSTPLRVDIPLGLAGGRENACADAGEITAARLVNMVGPVIRATPGYRTFLDLPPAAGRLRI